MHNSVYRADRKLSQILIRTYSGGALALLGHQHIIASQDVQGYILLNKATGLCQVDLFVPLGQLNVDDPQLRAEAALNTTPSPSDVEGTKNNMLKSIEATNYPFAELHSSDCSAALSGKKTRVVLTLHDVQQDRLLAIGLQQTQDNGLIVSGKFSILQTDFGIEPFSISNGLITVKNKLDLTYQVFFTQIN
ncbi:MAG TPA: YceI family protein [Psychromonas sp.]